MDKRPGKIVQIPITRMQDGQVRRQEDELATEEPLEIRLMIKQGSRWAPHPLAVTMRTPGNDFELAAGFLFTEGVIQNRQDIERLSYCSRTEEPQQYNVVNVYLKSELAFDPERLSRHVYTTSSCGVCGKTSIEQVRQACLQPPIGDFRLPQDYFFALPVALRGSQTLFARTGGLHASALFDKGGQLLLVREDVGRHNAMDKLVGALLLEGRLPASETVVLVSGRASFELVQKALMAGIPALAAVGAPSSLAVQLAQEFGMTLIGFLRENRLNVYSGAERIERGCEVAS